MEINVGIARLESELKQALEDLKGIQARADRVHVPGDQRFNPGWHQALTLQNMIVISEAMALSALERQESRGGHMRVDFLGERAEWSHHNHVIAKGPDGQMVLRREPLPEMPAELAELFGEKDKAAAK